MTMWAVTQNPPFSGRGVRRGARDWLSYYGENGIDKWMDAYFGGNVYDRSRGLPPRARRSPSSRTSRHPPSSWSATATSNARRRNRTSSGHALRILGVKTQFVIYSQHEGHEIGQPEHRRDIMRRHGGLVRREHALILARRARCGDGPTTRRPTAASVRDHPGRPDGGLVSLIRSEEC